MSEVLEAIKTRQLIRDYRKAFGWESDRVGENQKAFIKDLETFCGLRTAKFEMDEHEMVKQLGRIEVYSRIMFFLEYPNEMVKDLDKLIKGNDDE